MKRLRLLVLLFLPIILSSCGSPTPTDGIYIRGEVMRRTVSARLAIPDSLAMTTASLKLQTSVNALYQQFIENGNSFVIPADSLVDDDVLLLSPAKISSDNKVLVYIHEHLDSVPGSIIPLVNSIDVDFDSNGSFMHMHQAWVPIKRLKDVASRPQVRYISFVLDPVRSSAATDIIHSTEASTIAELPSVPKMSVGVISDDCGSRENEGLFQRLKEERKLGVDPIALIDNAPDRTHEGLAMMEVVAQVMPQANIKFATGITGIPQFIHSIKTLVANDCKVIVDDLLYLEEPAFSDGEIGKVIGHLTDSMGLIYVTSAGNFAKNVYSFQFNPLLAECYGILTSAAIGTVHNDISSYIKSDFSIQTGQNVRVMLQWDDKFGASRNDFDLHLVDNETNTIVSSSVDAQTVTGVPFEYLTYQGNACWGGKGYRIEIVRNDDAVNDNPTPRMKLMILGLDDSYDTPKENSIFGHACDTNVIACAAMAADPLVLGVQDYSSRGGAEIVQVISGADVLTGLRPPAPERYKPDVTGVDNVSTSVYNYSTFSGTSAAAPVVAGVIALMKASEPDVKRYNIIRALKEGCIDYESDGFDHNVGVGRVDAFRCIARLKHIRDDTRYFSIFTSNRSSASHIAYAPTAETGTVGVVYAVVTLDGFSGYDDFTMSIAHGSTNQDIITTDSDPATADTYSTVNLVVPGTLTSTSLSAFSGMTIGGEWKVISSLSYAAPVRDFGIFIVKSP